MPADHVSNSCMHAVNRLHSYQISLAHPAVLSLTMLYSAGSVGVSGGLMPSRLLPSLAPTYATVDFALAVHQASHLWPWQQALAGDAPCMQPGKRSRCARR